MSRWRPVFPGKRCEVELVLVANSIKLLNPQKSLVDVDFETEQLFMSYWRCHQSKPLAGRDELLSSICPQICGLFNVKLALALALIGGVHQTQDDITIRGEIHLLLVGDPGMGT